MSSRAQSRDLPIKTTNHQPRIMITRQISIFLENKRGRINDVTKVLAANNINMEAFCIAETSDFGLMRLIVSEVDRTVEVLRKADFAVIVTDVVSLRCKNVPGALSSVLETLAAKDIFIEYMYAFSRQETADVIIKPNDLAACVKILSEINPDNR